MADDAASSTWIGELRNGNPRAAQQLWDGYFDKLVRLARAKIPGRFRRAADEEDVAVSVMRTLMGRLVKGEFTDVSSKDELWRLLVRITACKSCKLMEREGRQKRGGGRVMDEAALATPGSENSERGIEQVIGKEPTPELVAQVADTYDHLLGLLPDETLRQVACLTLEGHTLEEIAKRLEFSVATAGRKLNRVRALWSVAE